MRLYIRQKSSYTLLSACYFNVYCCFLISILLYLYYMLPFYEGFFRIKPTIRTLFHNRADIVTGTDYILNLFTLYSNHYQPPFVRFNGFKEIIKEYITNYINIVD